MVPHKCYVIGTFWTEAEDYGGWLFVYCGLFGDYIESYASMALSDNTSKVSNTHGKHRLCVATHKVYLREATQEEIAKLRRTFYFPPLQEYDEIE